MGLMTEIQRVRIAVFKDDLRPMELLIGSDLLAALRADFGPFTSIMGMPVSKKCAGFGVSIRDSGGDLRRAAPPSS